MSDETGKRSRANMVRTRLVPTKGHAARLGEGDRSDAGDTPPGAYLLRLYVTGNTPASLRAIERVRRVCDENLFGRYDLEVIDIYQKPTLARDEQIIATPTLVRVRPIPLRRFIGDLSKFESVLSGLDLHGGSLG